MHLKTQRAIFAVLTALICLFFTLAITKPAHAGIATIYQCRTPYGTEAQVDLATSSGNPAIDLWLSYCSASNGALMLSSGPAGSNPTVSDRQLAFDAPGTTRFVGGNLVRQMYNYAYLNVGNGDADSWGYGYALTNAVGDVIERCGHGDAFPVLGSCGPAFAMFTAGSFTEFSTTKVALPPSATTSYRINVGCVYAGRCKHHYANPGVNSIAGEFQVLDESSPRDVIVGGALATADVTSNASDELTVSAADPGGLGVYRAVLAAGDRVIRDAVFTDNGGLCKDVNPANSTPFEFSSGHPCPESSPTLTFRASELPEGRSAVRVTVIDAAGNEVVAHNRNLTIDLIPAPTNTVLPKLAGTAEIGRTLAVDQGTWDVHGAAPASFTYVWQRCNAAGDSCRDVAGVSGPLYDVTAADAGSKLRARVLAKNSEGETASVSGTSAAVPAPPAPPTPPTTGDGSGSGGGGGGSGSGSTPPKSGPDRGGAGAPSGGLADVANGLPETRPLGTLNGDNASAQVRLVAHELGTERRTVRIRYGRTFTIAGQLRTADGRPISGARLEVLTQERRPGAQLRPEQAIVTAGDGSFRYVATPGPSRMIRLGYHERVGDTTFAKTTDVVVRVPAAVSFRLSRKSLRNGQTLRYLGRLSGPGTGHRFVEVQVRNGAKWQIVCSVRTDTRGSFACAHRFRRTVVRTTYTFRARVRKQAGMPYEPALSAAKRAKVHP